MPMHGRVKEMHFKLGKYSEAIQWYDIALEIDPNYEEAKNDKKGVLLMSRFLDQL